MGSADFAFVVEDQFGTVTGLVECVKHYPNYSDEKKWLYYIALAILGTKKNSYLTHAMATSTNYKDIPRALFRSILTLDRNDEDFPNSMRKEKTFLEHIRVFE